MKIKASTCEWMRRVSLLLTVMVFIFFWASFADFSGAKSDLQWKDVSSAGTALWVFLIVGAIIILLQLVPAIIMFFSLVGTGTQAIGKKSEVKHSKYGELLDESSGNEEMCCKPQKEEVK